MSEELDQLNDQNDIDLSSVSTDYPLLPKGAYKFKVGEVQIVESQKGGKNLKIKLLLNQMAKSQAGKDLTPGFPLTTQISLTPVHNPPKKPYTMEDVKRNLAVFQEAVLGRKGPLQPLEQYMDKDVTVNIGVRNDPQYGPQNSVDRFVKKQ